MDILEITVHTNLKLLADEIYYQADVFLSDTGVLHFWFPDVPAPSKLPKNHYKVRTPEQAVRIIKKYLRSIAH